ncbi:MAG: hypothetical protein AABZ33_10380 [Chloroflexota bacterium]
MPTRSWTTVLGFGALVALVALGAGARSPARAAPIDDPAAGTNSGVRLADIVACPGGPGRAAGAETWWRFAPVLDGAGSLVGWTLDGGTQEAALSTIALPAESSVSADVGGRVVVTADDGARSVIAVVSASDRCATVLAEVPMVARSGVLGGRDGTTWFHAVDRSTRRDLGVWRLTSASSGPAPFLGPLPDDDPAVLRVGRVFSTRLVLGGTDDQLAIQSCGERSCRTRVVHLATGREIRLEAPDQGLLLALERTRATFRDPCSGDPCAVRVVEFTPPSTEVLP